MVRFTVGLQAVIIVDGITLLLEYRKSVPLPRLGSRVRIPSPAPDFLLKKLDKTASVNVMVISLCSDWAHIGRYNLFSCFILTGLIENFCIDFR